MVVENFKNYMSERLKMHLNFQLWLKIILTFTYLKWLKMHMNFPPWLEKMLKFTKIYMSEIAKNALKLSTRVGENFKIYLFEMATNALKWSTMVGENFKIYMSEMANNTLKLSTIVAENVSTTHEQINQDMESHRYGERFIVPALLSLRERCGNAPIVLANFQGLLKVSLGLSFSKF